LILTIVLTIGSCKSKEEKQKEQLQDNLKTYFDINLKDSTAALDSFKLVKIDTITQKMLLFEQVSVLNNQLDYLLDIYKLTNHKMANSIDQMRLYGMLNSKTLVDIEKNDFDKVSEKSKEIKAELDTVIKIVKLLDSNSTKADTIKPVGFQAKCFYQVRLKDKSIKRDTTFILLNENKDIINRKDFLKLPYEIDFEKYN
jgi:hypothetical protein